MNTRSETTCVALTEGQMYWTRDLGSVKDLRALYMAMSTPVVSVELHDSLGLNSGHEKWDIMLLSRPTLGTGAASWITAGVLANVNKIMPVTIRILSTGLAEVEIET